MKRRKNNTLKNSAPSSSNAIQSFIEFVIKETQNKYRYFVGNKIISIDVFFDDKRANKYQLAIYSKDNMTLQENVSLVQKILEESANVVNAVLDQRPKTLDEMKKLYNSSTQEIAND